MYSRVVDRLQCPLCKSGLTEVEAGSGRALRCVNNHSFDIAKQGYANLAVPSLTHSGDTPEMVAARADFLEAGHYQFIVRGLTDYLLRMAESLSPRFLVEAGAGTGHYLGALLNALPDAAGLAFDVSRPALRRAGKAHPRMGAVLCDVWRPLPVGTGVAELLLCVFSPRNGAEFHRILRPDGVLLVVSPTAAHMQELIGPLGLLSVGIDKDLAIASSLGDGFVRVEETMHEQLLHLTHKEVRSLVQMGPSAWHVDSLALDSGISALPERVAVTASVHISSFRPV